MSETSFAHRQLASWKAWLTDRPFVRSETLILAVCAYFILICNGPFWKAALEGRSITDLSTWWFAGLTAVALVGVHLSVVAAVAPRALIKMLLLILTLVTAAATVFMQRYAVVLDPSMLRNVWRTDWPEASELLTIQSFLTTLLFALPPSAFILWVRVKRRRLLRAFVIRGCVIGFSLLTAALAGITVMQDLAPLLRVQHHVRYLVTPGNLLYSSGRTLFERDPQENARVHDRVVRMTNSGSQKPLLIVLVVGETARSANFSLNGYARNTNPELSKRNVVSFQEVSSCGTATEVSLPCMFSPFGRKQYDDEENQNHDGLLQVLSHAGFAVLWRDNQSGCKGACVGDGIRVEYAGKSRNPSLCSGERCLDEVLLEGLESAFRTTRGDLVIVLHQLGNHGPAYYKRYPSSYRRFTPTCDTAELRSCDDAAIVNTYDNAILYTDALLARVIDLLEEHSSVVDSAMLYVADHGESLGEGGLYLHGLPYAVAPSYQTRVPMIFWSSRGFKQRAALDWACVNERALDPASHDNLFSSVLGLADVSAHTYRRDLDLFAACRAGNYPVVTALIGDIHEN